MLEANKYSYKTLKVYQNAKSFVIEVYRLLQGFPAEERYALCDQVRRAAISVTSNIAEGVSRISNKEKVHFLEIAYASLKEVDSQMDISVDLGYITTDQYKELEKQVNEIGRQLSNLRSRYVSGIQTSTQP